MKKIYSMMAFLAIGIAMSAQVSVTLKVDITDYLAAGNVLGANGIRIGGNFGDTGAGIAQWAPSDPTCALVDEGSNVWAITITYPDASIGMEQLYKFVNNDWGTNEGTDAANTIGADGCGIDDGAGNVNRTLVVPGQDLGLQFCWDHCFRCDGSSPVIVVENVNTIAAATTLSVSPNPATNNVSIHFDISNATDVKIDLYNVTGQIVKTLGTSSYNAGFNNVNMSLLGVGKGFYFVNVNNTVTPIVVE